MSLLDRFRPKWQHSDTEVRAEAVRQLGRQDAELLSAVAQADPDPRVRRIAVKKLDNPKLLLEIGRNDPDEALRSYASERAHSILVDIAASDEDIEQSQRALALMQSQKSLAAVARTAQVPAIRLAALEQLIDSKALAEVARSAGEPELRRKALDRISDPATLRSIVTEHNAELAVAAVDKISDIDTLTAIAEDRKAPKSARRLAEQKLNTLVGEDHPFRQRQIRAQQAELCREVERLADDPDLGLALGKLQSIQADWERLREKASGMDEELSARFDGASKAILERKTLQERRRQQSEDKARALERDLATRRGLCEKLEQIDAAVEAHRIDELRAAWNELGPPHDDRSREISARFLNAWKAARKRQAEEQAWMELRSALQHLVEQAEKAVGEAPLGEAAKRVSEIKRKWLKRLREVSAAERQEELAALRSRWTAVEEQISTKREEERKREKAQRQENLDKLRELIERLDTLSGQEELVLKEAFKELRDSQHVPKEMGPLPSRESRKKWRARLSEARHRLYLRVQDCMETAEWQRWANVDLQEKLIKRMESLLGLEDLREAAKQMREIQAEWKQVSAVPKAQAEALWQRFKKARDEVRSRCEAFFETLDKERSENLKRKQELCEKVEALAGSTDWERTAQAIKDIQQQWRQIGAVPQRDSKAVWKRFRKACDQFFDRRKQHYDELKKEREHNLKLKVELCQRAEAVADSTDWRQTAEELKRLQAEWKKIGPVPRKKSDAVWKRFRKACDHFFERYKHRDEVELIDNLRTKQAVCEELESLLTASESAESADAELIAQRLRDAWARWKRLGAIPKPQEASIETRFRRVSERLMPTASEQLRGTELDPAVCRKKKQRLCERLEQLVNSYSPATDPLDGLAERLKTALAARTIGGGSALDADLGWKELARKVRRLKANWDRLGPVPGEAGEALQERFDKAYTRFLEMAPKGEGSVDQASTHRHVHR